MKGEECDYLVPLDKEGLGDRTETQRRLRWRCRRGLLELDVWLDKFAMTRMENLSAEEGVLLETLLEESDMSLLDWLESRQAPPLAYAELLEKIRTSV